MNRPRDRCRFRSCFEPSFDGCMASRAEWRSGGGGHTNRCAACLGGRRVAPGRGSLAGGAHRREHALAPATHRCGVSDAINPANGNQSNGLVPGWCDDSNGAPCTAAAGELFTYQYDACRTPFRIGLDACLKRRTARPGVRGAHELVLRPDRRDEHRRRLRPRWHPAASPRRPPLPAS